MDKLEEARKIEEDYGAEMDDIMMLTDEEFNTGYNPGVHRNSIFGNYEYYLNLELIFPLELLYVSYNKIDRINSYVGTIMSLIPKEASNDKELTDVQIDIFVELSKQLEKLIRYFEKEIKEQQERVDRETSYYLKSEINQDILIDTQMLGKIHNIYHQVSAGVALMEKSKSFGGR